MFYYPTRELAQAIADKIKLDERVGHAYTTLEPNNGWVVVAVPKWYDITDLKDVCLIHSPTGVQITFPPPGAKKKYQPLQTPMASVAQRPIVKIQPLEFTIKAPWQT